MGNRAKKTKKGIIRPAKPTVLTKTNTDTPKLEIGQKDANNGLTTSFIPSEKNTAPKPSQDAPLCRLNNAIVPSVTVTKPSPLRHLAEWKGHSTPSRSLIGNDKNKVEKKLFYLEYTKPRLIEDALPEIAIPFPDDAHLNDNALTDYKAVVESYKMKLKQREIDHQHALEERWKSEDWFQVTSNKYQSREAWARMNYLDYIEYYNGLTAQQNEKLSVRAKRMIDTILQKGDLFLPGVHFPNETSSLGRRFPWKNGKTTGMVYYDFLPKNPNDPVIPDNIQTTKDIRMGTVPEAYIAPGELAQRNARLHRFYSESIGLWHCPFNPLIQSFRKAMIYFPNQAILYNLVSQFYIRSASLRSEMEYEFHERSQRPVYHPDQSGDFHSGRRPIWLHAMNHAMIVYANSGEEVQRGVKTRIIHGIETTNWYAFDVRELGPMMQAIRGYFDHQSTMNPGDCPRMGMASELLKLTVNEFRSKPHLNRQIEAQLTTITPADQYRQTWLYGYGVPQTGRHCMMIDQQKALNAVIAHAEMSRLSHQLLEIITLDPGKKQQFLAPRHINGAQYPAPSVWQGRNNSNIHLRETKNKMQNMRRITINGISYQNLVDITIS
ncbi:hypothetical protein BZA77DRAFT_357877 [Pyronema omphalodes]|nr:hypothetical protein BZA77DRAFT_357877 [Pyronema omphalodes]